jgi:hypothetical protein
MKLSLDADALHIQTFNLEEVSTRTQRERGTVHAHSDPDPKPEPFTHNPVCKLPTYCCPSFETMQRTCSDMCFTEGDLCRV